MCVGSLMHVPDAQLHTGREVFICGLHSCLFVSVAHQAASRLVHIVLEESLLLLC